MASNTVQTLFLCTLVFHREVVLAQEAATRPPIVHPLALGGMVQGLLDMQIRPQGGFYEERYKDIFSGGAKVALATTDFGRRHSVSNPVKSKQILSEDGQLLADAASGKSPNPCFDQERIARNRLLLLLCSLKLSEMPLFDNEV